MSLTLAKAFIQQGLFEEGDLWQASASPCFQRLTLVQREFSDKSTLVHSLQRRGRAKVRQTARVAARRNHALSEAL